MTHQFAQPSSGSFFKPADHHGHLILIIAVTETGERYDSMYGKDKPFAVVDMVDLDDPAPKLQQGVTVSHPGICNKLGTAARTGEMVLGRVGQIPTEKGNPAWVLGPFTPGADDMRASAWLTANPINNFGQPAQQQAPAPAPAPQPQPVPAPVPQPVPQAPAPQPIQYAPQPVPPAAPVPQAPTLAQVGQAMTQAQQPPAAPAAAPPQPAAPAPAAPQTIGGVDVTNLTPEVIALLQKLPQQQ
ncbi:hypothetical protein [Actinomadura sp. KC06]|uniref:hypothetical protein n=1 Tax=Actinomadura sp. KC06 TaxID=2530369 RepID=UPI001A9D37F6|nr:hypothetical protein [Actinomadura sp. KC06]